MPPKGLPRLKSREQTTYQTDHRNWGQLKQPRRGIQTLGSKVEAWHLGKGKPYALSGRPWKLK